MWTVSLAVRASRASFTEVMDSGWRGARRQEGRRKGEGRERTEIIMGKEVNSSYITS